MAAPRKRPVAIDTVPLPANGPLATPVRVTVPAKVAFDLGRMQRVTASVLARFGCPQCHSGLDIRFDIATRFQVDDSLNLHEQVGGGVVING